ncbi:DEAD/DEAH box helicase [Gimesia fumaroli]|uniref:Ski2-like helicase n=1 Tax=Gimesia fumaroli TaxID=2527976 RepID=A0A518ICB0_9PLAN|nr:DEAD/DEAH box helicase [Gimesia fumaroli]QDV50741.1 ski2-like helicase [Gimesia fumaroli]
MSKRKIDEKQLSSKMSQAGWLATLLADSKSHEHRQKALLFAALIKMNFPESQSVETLCYCIFSRTGTLPAAMHLKKIVGSKLEYRGPALGLLTDEYFGAYTKNFTDLAGGIVLTDFQKTTADSLSQQIPCVISAPTSAGKSFIIHEYVKNCLCTEAKFVTLFIVPTKALISQICAIYRKLSSETDHDIGVYSSVPDDFEKTQSKLVFALTQERCIRLLNSPVVQELDFIFIDEIQALEDGERGALLEYVIQELKSLVKNRASFFAAGPFISNGRELGQKLFFEESSNIETEDTPVSQILTKLKPLKKQKELEVVIVAPSSKLGDYSFRISTKRSFYSRWRQSNTNAICDALEIFSTESPSIVYAPGPGTAQNWAKKFIVDREKPVGLSDEIKDLISYIKDSIHPRCSLVGCLETRVAYHHGKLPDFVREEIEELISQREIEVLFCTTTLLEGVNLPVDKIFILSTEKADEKLSDFEFKNLIGRAGRLDQHLCGMIYCIQLTKEGETDWVDSYRHETKKEVIPTTNKKMVEHYAVINQMLKNGSLNLPEDDKHKLNSSVTVLRSRYLKNPDSAMKYLESKDITEDQQNQLIDSVRESVKALSIPSDLVLKNPVIDPFLQNLLYEDVLRDSEKWKIRRERGFSTDLEKVFKELDKIFHIISEINPRGKHEYYRNDLLTFAKLWLLGEPFKKIVNRALPRSLREENNVENKEVENEQVDKAITKSMNFITRDISFITAKYFSVLADILEEILPEESLDDFAMTLNLPVMLELGSNEPKSLALISACIPRGAAIQIAPLIPDSIEDPVSWLSLNQDFGPLQKLSSIYHKILKKCGIWS